MSLYLAKIGRKPWAKYVLPSSAVLCSLAYCQGLHQWGHDIVKNYLAAQSPSGHPEILSDDLKELVVSVYKDIFKDDMEERKKLMKWFCSATMDPMSIGSIASGFRGCLIGLPPHFNYKSIDDVPRTMKQFKSLKFLKSFENNSKQMNEEQKHLEELGYDSKDLEFMSRKEISMNQQEEVFSRYLNSIVLSDNAKRFAIAREIFYTDNLQPLVKAHMLICAIMIPAGFHRYWVEFAALHEAHIQRRIPIYLASAMAAVMLLRVLFAMVETGYDAKSDKRALSLGEPYRTGAVEYYSKQLERNKALRVIYPDLKDHFDEMGNPRKPSWVFHRSRVTRKLRLATDFQPTEEKKSRLF